MAIQTERKKNHTSVQQFEIRGPFHIVSPSFLAVKQLT